MFFCNIFSLFSYNQSVLIKFTEMKRLFVIVKILLFTSTIGFGQKTFEYFGLRNMFHERPEYEFHNVAFAGEFGADGRFINTLTPQKFKILLDSQYVKKYLNEYTISFTNNGKFYMLSYDDSCSQICYDREWQHFKLLERNLYLFRLDDSGWTKASDKPVEVDYEDNRNSKGAYMLYFPRRMAGSKPEHEKLLAGGKNGSVEISSNGFVTINIIYNSDQSKYSSFNKTVTLIPNGNNTYNVQ